jgi:dephospho-CoA kinase
MVFAVGLTGNIASGKTTAADFFSCFGVEVINADKISRELTQKNTEAYKQIITHYGPSILIADEEINRKRLRDIIFTDLNERIWLENLLHPLIRKELKKRVALCTTPYCIVEIPLLINKDNYPYLNKILVITSPEKKQIARVIKRDQCTEEQAIAILTTQPTEDLRLKNADDVIINDSGLAELKKSIEKLHYKYLNNLI